MSPKPITKTQLLTVRQDFITGIDVGGTKIHINDTLSNSVKRFITADYSSMNAVLEKYFQQKGSKPSCLIIGMAGPRDDETGEIKLTNTDWPMFNPKAASIKYGVRIETVNDMVATTAGVLQEAGVDLVTLKTGTPAQTGTKLIVSLSTGVGVAAAFWDSHSNRYVVLAGEGGHMGFHPKDREEQRYLDFLHKKYLHASTELALSGKHGISNLIDHHSKILDSPKLLKAVKKARKDGNPLGTVLLEFATEGHGADQQVSQILLKKLGSMIGSALRNMALIYRATGGVYLTGGVAESLGEYFAEQTDFNDRFVCRGAVHDLWLEKVPINLVTNPFVASVGALVLAKDL